MTTGQHAESSTPLDTLAGSKFLERLILYADFLFSDLLHDDLDIAHHEHTLTNFILHQLHELRINHVGAYWEGVFVASEALFESTSTASGPKLQRVQLSAGFESSNNLTDATTIRELCKLQDQAKAAGTNLECIDDSEFQSLHALNSSTCVYLADSYWGLSTIAPNLYKARDGPSYQATGHVLSVGGVSTKTFSGPRWPTP